MPERGNEPDQRDVPINIPPYDSSSVPGERPTPGTPRAGQLVRDPERVTVPETPVSQSPTKMRTRPFLPARHDPEYLPTPVQPVAEIVQGPVQFPPHTTFTEPTPIRKRVTRLPEPERAPQKFNPNLNPGEILDEIPVEISKPKVELDPKQKVEQKPEEVGKPTTPLQPKFTTKLYGKQKGNPGRQRGKDRNDSGDGVRQLFELWWSKGSRGVPFQQFYQNHLSKSMRFYYPREYIHGANPKSAAEYRQWRKEWTRQTCG